MNDWENAFKRRLLQNLALLPVALLIWLLLWLTQTCV